MIQILMYHRVGHFPGRVKAHGALYCHLPRFRAQMTLFRVLGYTVISLDDAVAGLRGDKALPPRPLVLVGEGWRRVFLTYQENMGSYLMSGDERWILYAENVESALRLAENHSAGSGK